MGTLVGCILGVILVDQIQRMLVGYSVLAAYGRFLWRRVIC